MRAQKTNKSGHEYESNHTIEYTTVTERDQFKQSLQEKCTPPIILIFDLVDFFAWSLTRTVKVRV